MLYIVIHEFTRMSCSVEWHDMSVQSAVLPSSALSGCMEWDQLFLMADSKIVLSYMYALYKLCDHE